MDVIVVLGMVAMAFSVVSNFVAARRPSIRQPLYRIGAWGSLFMLLVLALVYVGVIDADAGRIWIVAATLAFTAWGAFSLVDW